MTSPKKGVGSLFQLGRAMIKRCVPDRAQKTNTGRKRIPTPRVVTSCATCRSNPSVWPMGQPTRACQTRNRSRRHALASRIHSPGLTAQAFGSCDSEVSQHRRFFGPIADPIPAVARSDLLGPHRRESFLQSSTDTSLVIGWVGIPIEVVRAVASDGADIVADGGTRQSCNERGASQEMPPHNDCCDV